jgi:hypothetical protein
MTLLKEEIVSSALEVAIEDIGFAVSEMAMPDFDSFPKTKHALLESLINQDRQDVCVMAERSVMQAVKQVQSILENNLEIDDDSLKEFAELLAEKLRNATKEDKRIVSVILSSCLL